jgi:hypothetical protein
MPVVARWIDYQGRTVELTEERWEHILGRHEDMRNRVDLIGTAVVGASLVVRDSPIRRLEHHYVVLRDDLRVHVAVIYRPVPEGWVGTILTAHLTDRIKRGEQLWP